MFNHLSFASLWSLTVSLSHCHHHVHQVSQHLLKQTTQTLKLSFGLLFWDKLCIWDRERLEHSLIHTSLSHCTHQHHINITLLWFPIWGSIPHPTITADYYAIMTNGIGLYDLAESRLSTENEMLAVVFGVASKKQLWTHNKTEKLAKVDKKVC